MRYFATPILLSWILVGCAINKGQGPAIWSMDDNKEHVVTRYAPEADGEIHAFPTHLDRASDKGRETARRLVYGLVGWVILDDSSLTFVAWDEDRDEWYQRKRIMYADIGQAEYVGSRGLRPAYVSIFTDEWTTFTAEDDELVTILSQHVELEILE